MAGIIKFTIQIKAAENTIPTVLALSKPNNCRLTSPRTPNSAMFGTDGMTDKIKNNTAVANAAHNHAICTSNN